jgi:hypothetical protein
MYMSNICKTVTLRTRKIKGGEQLSYYLDYYPGYRDESTMKVMRHESLGIYIYAKPKNQRERDYNDRMREKAEALRCRRFESIVNERYDFFDKEKMKGDFLAYFKGKAEKKGGATRLPSVSGRAPHQMGERLHALREVHQGKVPFRRNQRRPLQQVP